MKQLNVLFVCLGLVAASCTIPEPQSVCGEHMEGYVEIDGRCVGNREESCDKTKEAKVSCTESNETYDATANACICNAPYFRVNGKCVASSSLAVGDLVEFGRYPQSENSDLPSPLTWQVLDIKDDAVLMLSKYVLEQYQYHDADEYITWEKSNVRSYLNALSGKYNKNNIDHTKNGFIDRAFGTEEQKRIKEVTNKNPKPPENWESTPGGNDTEDWGSTPSGNDTKDKVFLLSYYEVVQYFPTFKSRVASPTAYAIHPPESSGRNNLYTCQVTCSGDDSCSESSCNDDGINARECSNVQYISHWWLRSPDGSFASGVDCDGGVNDDDVDFDNSGLRPALYVSF